MLNLCSNDKYSKNRANAYSLLKARSVTVYPCYNLVNSRKSLEGIEFSTSKTCHCLQVVARSWKLPSARKLGVQGTGAADAGENFDKLNKGLRKLENFLKNSHKFMNAYCGTK